MATLLSPICWCSLHNNKKNLSLRANFSHLKGAWVVIKYLIYAIAGQARNDT